MLCIQPCVCMQRPKILQVFSTIIFHHIQLRQGLSLKVIPAFPVSSWDPLVLTTRPPHAPRKQPAVESQATLNLHKSAGNSNTALHAYTNKYSLMHGGVSSALDPELRILRPPLPSASIIDMFHHAWFMRCCGSNPGWWYLTTVATSTVPYFLICSNICVYRLREVLRAKVPWMSRP